MFLYLRMFVSIIVNLYTVRLLWNVLGVDNYGIYNVVGGIVMMFAFLNNAMVASSQRFISFALGQNNLERLQKTFSMSVTVHTLLALIVLILAETIGLWFLNYKLNIPAGRMVAANWVYQCSIITFLITIISVPYNACIVAHEHMKIYGYFGIVEVFFKLGIVLLVTVLPFDSLISYAVLLMCLSFGMRLFYTLYCRRHFIECKIVRFKDKDLMNDMFSFAGWSFLGNMGFSVRDQGMNIILNMFFNVAVNAAKGVANQVGTVINGFATNFTMALNPQLTKRYANGDIQDMLKLLFYGCKFSLFLMSFIVIPLIFAAPTVLKLWLRDIAPYTIGFLRLVLVIALIDCVVSPITTSLQATGNIKKFQIVISIIMVANLPLAWMWLRYELNPYVVMWVAILTSVIALVSRLILLHELIKFSYLEFIKIVYLRTVLFMIIFGILSGWLYPFFTTNIIGIICYFVVELSVGLIFGYWIALNSSEKIKVKKAISQRINRRSNALPKH